MLEIIKITAIGHGATIALCLVSIGLLMRKGTVSSQLFAAGLAIMTFSMVFGIPITNFVWEKWQPVESYVNHALTGLAVDTLFAVGLALCVYSFYRVDRHA